jgi:ribonuclease BN (tRNA processing enzyme)
MNKKIKYILGLSLTAIVIVGCTVMIKTKSMEKVLNHKVLAAQTNKTYPIVDTGTKNLYSDKEVLTSISEGEDFYGQDASYQINEPSYTDNGDGTVTDNVTGLMWQQTMDSKMSATDAVAYANSSELGGYKDWRIPSIKELYSLTNFDGKVLGETAVNMFIDTEFFNQPIGDTSIGEREIDAQTWSSTEYVGKTMNNDETIFGVNFVDGRIKGYPKYSPKTREENKMYFRLVRGNEEYGQNNFVDNGDGTISDLATGLMWQKADDGVARDWENSLSYSENLDASGYDDWRLPTSKELQSIVDYTRSPQTTSSPAINEMFSLTSIKDINGNTQYPHYWTSTTLCDGKNPAGEGVYVCFGDGQGMINNKLVDAHGAGAVRSEPKSGNTSDYPKSFGPQGDIQYVYNYALSVRSIEGTTEIRDSAVNTKIKDSAVTTPTESIKNNSEKSAIIPYSPQSDFSVITVGTGTPDVNLDKSSASTMIQYQGKYLLVDCGDGTNKNLYKGGFKDGDIKSILFTHLHSDHTSDFTDITISNIISNNNHLDIIGPPRTSKLYDLIKDVYADDITYRMMSISKKTGRAVDNQKIYNSVAVKELTGENTFKLNGLTVSTAEMTHTMYDLAYRFDVGGKSIVVSGDTSYDPDLAVLAKNADILVIDGSGSTNENALNNKVKSNSKKIKLPTPAYEYSGNFGVDAHATFSDIVKMATDANVKKLVLTHYSEASDAIKQERIAEINKTFKGEVIFAEDLMEINP